MKSNEKNEQDITKQIEEKSISESEVKECLNKAFKDQNINLIKLIINNYPKIANQAMKYDYYPINRVFYIENINDRHETISLLLANGADINIQPNKHSQTPLMIAFTQKQIQTFNFLISRNAKISVIRVFTEDYFDLLEIEKPYIQYKVDSYFDDLKLGEDDKSILRELKKSYQMNFCNYDKTLEIFDWYHSLSEKYKDEAYKSKIHTLFVKAKKDAIEYMLILQDSLLNNYFQDEDNPKSMLMIKHDSLDEQQKAELTNEEIKQLEDSIIPFLFVIKGRTCYIPVLMTRNNDEGIALKDLISKSEDYCLPFRLTFEVNRIIRNYNEYSKNSLIHLAHETLDKENEIEELKAKLAKLSKENAELKGRLLQEDTTPQYKNVILANDVAVSIHSDSNSEENGVKITGYEIEYFV